MKPRLRIRIDQLGDLHAGLPKAAAKSCTTVADINPALCP